MCLNEINETILFMCFVLAEPKINSKDAEFKIKIFFNITFDIVLIKISHYFQKLSNSKATDVSCGATVELVYHVGTVYFLLFCSSEEPPSLALLF